MELPEVIAGTAGTENTLIPLLNFHWVASVARMHGTARGGRSRNLPSVSIRYTLSHELANWPSSWRDSI